MMNYDMMMGLSGGGMMFFAWFTYLLVNVALVFAILSMVKFLQKK